MNTEELLKTVYTVPNNMAEPLLCHFTDFMYKYEYMWSLIESGVYIHYFVITDFDLLE